MTSFALRAGPHDTQALNLVVSAFRAEGFCNFDYGTERSDSPALQKALRQQHDRTSIMLRYRPDQVFVKPGARTVLCEVKSEGGGSPNFSVEADAYVAGREWNTDYRHVLYAFCDLGVGRNYACWADELRAPAIIRVPTRPDYLETIRRLDGRFGAGVCRTCAWTRGSGTAYFLVPKPRPGQRTPLRPLGLFVRHDVWAAVNGMGQTA